MSNFKNKFISVGMKLVFVFYLVMAVLSIRGQSYIFLIGILLIGSILFMEKKIGYVLSKIVIGFFAICIPVTMLSPFFYYDLQPIGKYNHWIFFFGVVGEFLLLFMFYSLGEHQKNKIKNV